MNINELKSLKNDKVTEAKKLIDAAEALGSELTDEQKERVKTLTQDAGKLDGQIKAAQEREREAIATREALDALIEPAAQPASGAAPVIPVADVSEPNWKKHETNTLDLSSFMVGAYTSATTGKVPPKMMDYQKIEAAAGADEQSVISNPYGGFTVPDKLNPTIIKIDPEVNPMAGRTTMFNMTLPKESYPARVDKTHTSSVSGGLTVSRSIETQYSASSKIEMEQINFNATPLDGHAFATRQVLDYSLESWSQIITSGFDDEFESKLVKERISGTGAGMYLGVLNSDATVSQAKLTGQVAKTIEAENVQNMRSRCYKYGRAIWLANHDCYPELAKMSITVGTGGELVYQPSVVEDRPDFLLGRPIFYTEYCKTLGTVGDLILANWGEYWEGSLGGEGVKSAQSIHVRFLEAETTFKFWKENDGKPSWLTYLTPAESSTTLSPFVTLATRA